MTMNTQSDERVLKTSLVRRLLARPELGAIGGAVCVWIFFAIVAGDRVFLTLRGTATYFEVAAELGILAVAVALLMIGGEFEVGGRNASCPLRASRRFSRD